MPYVKQIPSRGSMYDEGNPEPRGVGWEGGGGAVPEGGDTCTPDADSR